MKKSLKISLAAGLTCGLAGIASGQTFSSGPIAVAIPDSPTVQTSITVAGGPVVTGDVDIRLNITHTFDGDLDIVVIVPGGTEYIHLSTDNGSGGDNFSDTIFDQDAAASIVGSAAPFAGSFRPEGGLATFAAGSILPISGLTPVANLDSLNGRDSNGTWTLRIDDDAGGDVGTINEWAVILLGTNDPIPPSVTLTLSPNNGAVGTSILATAAFTSGANPPSTGVTVSLDASTIDGGTVTLLDDGMGPDAAIDNVYSGNVVVGPAASLGVQTLTVTAADDVPRSATASATFQVRPPAAANDLCQNATLISGPFPVATAGDFIEGNAIPPEAPASCQTSSNYTVWYKVVGAGDRVRIRTDPAVATGNNVADPIVSVYESADGSCSSLTQVACDDDSGVGLHADVTTNFLTAGTTYYIQVGKFLTTAPAAGATLGIFIEQLVSTGACCVTGSCSVLSAADCQAAGGLYLGNDALCVTPGEYVSDGTAGSFEDISATGTPLTLGDDANVNIPIGFSFTHYSAAFTDVFVGSNGLLTFGVGSNVFTNTAIPSVALPNNAIYPYWDDLNPALGGTVVYQNLGTSGFDLRLIVQYTAVPQFGLPADANTFQAVLFESGEVEFRYGVLGTPNDLVTIGFENADGTVATSFVRDDVVSTGVRAILTDDTDNCGTGGCDSDITSCRADQDGDEDIDSDDITLFFSNFENGDSCGDQDGDDDVDSDDITIFFSRFEAGGC